MITLVIAILGDFFDQLQERDDASVLFNMDEALSPEQFDSLVQQVKKEKCPRRRLEINASMASQLYGAEKAQLSFLRGGLHRNGSEFPLEAQFDDF